MVYLGPKIASILQTVYLQNKILLVATVLLIGCNTQNKELPYYNSPDFTPIFTNDTKSITHQIADFSFTDQNSQTITQKNIEGKIHVANFIFTTCGSICPLMTNQMKAVSDTFKNDQQVVILSYSVTPWIDNTEILKKYTEKKNIHHQNWHFLTGEKSKIYKLARQSYFAEEDIGFTRDSSEFLHTEHCILVDQNKHIRGIYNGTLPLEMQQLIEDIKLLKR